MFKKLNTYIYAILADNKKNALKMHQKYSRIFPIFYDENKKIVRNLNQEIKILKMGRMSGLLIIDKHGIITYTYYSDNMHDIPENRILLNELRKLNK
ncbi:MAG: redoxin domain-containing protein [Candidatus Lokiarchaeota archaeon]|nr:redoxin domain-containing protein [Candidatus Lokiarchaeota archaeon]